MQVRIDGLDRLLGVNGGHTRNHDGLETFLLQHLVEIGVQPHAERLEVGPCPCKLAFIWRAGRDEFGAWGAVEEVKGMPFPHATEPCAGYLESLRCHDGRSLGYQCNAANVVDEE